MKQEIFHNIIGNLISLSVGPDGVAITLPETAPARPGYRFIGWKVNEGELLFNGEVYNVITDSIITATEEKVPVSYVPSVSYNTVVLQSDTGSAIVSVQSGFRMSRPADPVKEGYIFTGWYTDKACTEPYDFSKTVTGGMTLYAGWEKAEGMIPMFQFSKTVYKGSKFKLSLGNLEDDAKITVTNTKKSVASASKAGVITAKKAGKATITYEIEQNGQEYRFRAVITVKNKGISYNLRDTYVTEGNLPVLSVYKKVVKGKTTTMKLLDLEDDAEVTFTSDNKKVAKVNKNGKITGVKKGKAIITAEVKQNGVVYTYQMVVRVSDGTKDKDIMKYLK